MTHAADVSSIAMGTSVKALHCCGCGAVLATTETPPDIFKWAHRMYRWNHFGTRSFCDNCS